MAVAVAVGSWQSTLVVTGDWLSGHWGRFMCDQELTRGLPGLLAQDGRVAQD